MEGVDVPGTMQTGGNPSDGGKEALEEQHPGTGSAASASSRGAADSKSYDTTPQGLGWLWPLGSGNYPDTLSSSPLASSYSDVSRGHTMGLGQWHRGSAGAMGTGSSAALTQPWFTLGAVWFASTSRDAYVNTPFAVLPSGEVALRLGKHLFTAIWEKITRDEFIDIFSLLYQEVEKKKIRMSWTTRRRRSLGKGRLTRLGPTGFQDFSYMPVS